MVIDIHTHTALYQSTSESYASFLRKQWGDRTDWMIERYSSPEVFLELMDEAGVDYAVVLAEVAPVTTGIAGNEYVARFCSHSPRLIPFASINPYITPRPAQELERLVREYGFRGLKLYPTYQYYYLNDSIMYPVYEKAQELSLLVSIHTGSSVFAGSRIKYGDPLQLDDVAVDFPELKLLMCHCGRPFWYDHAFGMARFHKNMFMEIAGLPPQKLLTYFPELERVADKVIYGSDWPGVPSMAENVKAVRSLPISEQSKEKFLWQNAARLLGMSSPQDIARKASAGK